MTIGIFTRLNMYKPRIELGFLVLNKISKKIYENNFI